MMKHSDSINKVHGHGNFNFFEKIICHYALQFIFVFFIYFLYSFSAGDSGIIPVRKRQKRIQSKIKKGKHYKPLTVVIESN